jgi:hypothetical protein
VTDTFTSLLSSTERGYVARPGSSWWIIRGRTACLGRGTPRSVVEVVHECTGVLWLDSRVRGNDEREW